MKIRFYLALAAAALVMTNCSQDEELVQIKQSSKGFIATIEGASRSDVTEAGVFSWTAGDKISVWNGSTFDVYANSEGNVSAFDAPTNAGTPTDYAIYPAGSHSVAQDGTVTIDLPATYTHGSTNAPMLATIESGSTTLSFKHLAGVMRFVVKNVPAKASSFVFTTTNDILTGKHTVYSEGEIKQDGENTADATNNNVTITFAALNEVATEMIFFVPLPVGTYGDYKVEIKGDGVDLSHTSVGVTNIIGRRTLLLMPEFTVNGSTLEKGKGNTIPVTQNEAAELSGNQSVTISTDGAGTNEELDLNYTPEEGNASLNITDGSSATTPQNSIAKIKINPQGSTPVESLNLNTPTLTAELGAGTYGKVEALTAKQTLIIGDGVIIDELVLNGGALEIAEDATNVTIGNIVVKDELGLRSAVAAGGKVTLINNITLTELDNCLWIKKDCEIALNGYGITHAQSTVIKIAAGNTLTIGGEGTVATTDNYCSAIANYGGTLVINGGTYKSQNVAAIYCDRVASGEERKGTWNLTINDGEFITESNTAVSLQNNRANAGKTGYENGLAQINKGTFTSGGNGFDLYLANVIANITTSSCTFTNDKVYLLTKGAAIDGGEGTWSSLINGTEMTLENANGMYLVSKETGLRSAVAAGGKVTLINNITLTGLDNCLWINKDCEIALNGYGITHAQSTVIKIAAGNTLTIGGEGASTVATTDNYCSAIANYGGTLVINGGTYKSQNVAAIYCDRAPKGGERKGTWNLTINDGEFITESNTAVSLQNNRANAGKTGYENGLAQINKGTFTSGGTGFDLYLANVIADITTSGCTFTNDRVYLLTQGADIDSGTSAWSSIINGNEMTNGNSLITIPEKATGD